jgi:hypothetical protein
MLQLERNIVILIQPILNGVSCVEVINKNDRLDKTVYKDDLPFSKDKKEMFSHFVWIPAVVKFMECQ